MQNLAVLILPGTWSSLAEFKAAIKKQAPTKSRVRIAESAAASEDPMFYNRFGPSQLLPATPAR
ncbi:hypothetical protein CTP10_R65520 (plasmid) [Cupriavidus sp. P-10]|uniref:hypothetical protein n=1 Tax=Cupriavidus sp. P-10 TaxID=2027911 RepID=UPI0011C1C38C|nr:hypothetical protein [Cupriavidus sp. P-10]BDB29139.1 hypothetical protein CTP10_R65520 [Cupriavidus sp. P-10]